MSKKSKPQARAKNSPPKQHKGKHNNASNNKPPNRSSANRQSTQQQRPKTPLLYGTHAVTEAWLNPKRQINTLYITEQSLGSFEPAIEKTRSAGLKRPTPQIIDKAKLENLLPEAAVHQGLALSAAPLPEYNAQDIIIKNEQTERPLIVILDQVTDPHNIGAILRSACAFGASALILQKKHAPELTGVLAKTACGALEHVPVAFVTNLSRTIEEFQEAGYFSYGLDERGEENIQYIAKTRDKTLIIMGAEGPGLRQNVKAHCDTLLRLPMHGPMPSINVSNAAAITLYALTQK